MRFEINYNIKTSDLVCIDLKDKRWTLKSSAGKKIMQIMKMTTVEFI